MLYDQYATLAGNPDWHTDDLTLLNPSLKADIVSMQLYPEWIPNQPSPQQALSMLLNFTPGFTQQLQSFNKPFMMIEFGAPRSRYASAADAKNYLLDWQVASCDYKITGWNFFNWSATNFDYWTSTENDYYLAKAFSPNYRPNPCSKDMLTGPEPVFTPVAFSCINANQPVGAHIFNIYWPKTETGIDSVQVSTNPDFSNPYTLGSGYFVDAGSNMLAKGPGNFSNNFQSAFTAGATYYARLMRGATPGPAGVFKVPACSPGSQPQPTASGVTKAEDMNVVFSANPDPCTLESSGICKSTIYWTSQNVPDLQIRLDSNGQFLSSQKEGNMELPWVTSQGLKINAWATVNGASTIVKTYTIKAKTLESQVVLTATPDPCVLINGVCSSTLYWTSKDAQDFQVRLDDANATFLSSQKEGNMELPWVTSQGLKINAWATVNGQPTILKSYSIKGLPPITASPNPCKLGSNGLCSTTLKLNTDGRQSNLEIRIRGNTTSVTGTNADPNRTYDLPWITAGGYTFDVYSNGGVIGSVSVRGQK